MRIAVLWLAKYHAAALFSGSPENAPIPGPQIPDETTEKSCKHEHLSLSPCSSSSIVISAATAAAAVSVHPTEYAEGPN